MDKKDFLIVTERGGEAVTAAQLDRFYQRYLWAGSYCAGKDVLELACGTGPGLGYLQSVARSLVAGDISESVLQIAKRHYGERVDLRYLDAAETPFIDGSFEVIILFEAIYYLPDVEKFFTEARRLLRPGGFLLIATANKDLFDFNPSPFSQKYFNSPELKGLFRRHSFDATFFAGSPVSNGGSKKLLFRWIKKIAAAMRLIPRSMKGKRFLKRLVYGRLVEMPKELDFRNAKYIEPVAISDEGSDLTHQVLYCVATKR